MSFCINDGKFFEKYKTIWTKIEDLKSIKLNVLPVNKITYSDKVHTNFWGLRVAEDGTECESFIIISIDSLFVNENKYYLLVYLVNCAFKNIDKQMIKYPGNYLFYSDEN